MAQLVYLSGYFPAQQPDKRAKKRGKEKPGEGKEQHLDDLPAEKEQFHSQRAEADRYKSAARWQLQLPRFVRRGPG